MRAWNDGNMATTTTAVTTVMSSDQNFPSKLYECLTELEATGLEDIASFQPHGRCFVVHKQHAFVERVLSRWFRQTKYQSFQRQLNIYGFQRITSGPDKNGYFHPCFLRGKPELLRRIPRIGIKGTGPRKASSLEPQPNFYTTPFLVATPVARASVTLPRDNAPDGTLALATTEAAFPAEPRSTLWSLVRHGIGGLQGSNMHQAPSGFPPFSASVAPLSTALPSANDLGLSRARALDLLSRQRVVDTMRRLREQQAHDQNQRLLALLSPTRLAPAVQSRVAHPVAPLAAGNYPSPTSLALLLTEQAHRRRVDMFRAQMSSLHR